MMKKLFASTRAVALSIGVMGAAWVCHAQVMVELNFTEARIDAVAASVGAMVGKNVVVDPKVKGTMTLVSDSPVTPANALAQLQAALRMHGYAMVDAGAIFKVVLEADAKSHASKVNAAAVGAEIQTRVFKLQHENASQVLNVVKPLVSPNNVVNVNAGNNALVVTDYADNIARIAKLIASLDQASASDLEIIPLEHAIASEMVPLLQQLVNGAGIGSGAGLGRAAADPALDSVLMADSRSNALIVRAANPAKLAQIRSLVQRLDQPSIQNATSSGNLHVVYLKHADAVALAETLRAAIRTLEEAAPGAKLSGNLSSGVLQSTTSSRAGNSSGMAGLTNSAETATGTGSGGGLGSTGSLTLGQTQMPSVGGLVQADPNTNSLIITAPAPLYRQLRAVIDKLDSRRAQVLVESMIVEVSDNKLSEFGVQWQAALGGNGKTGAVIGNNSSLVGGNILGIAAGLASGDTTAMANALNSLGGGLNLAIAPKALGQYYLGALANFLQQDGSSNVLSKPNLLTLDNQEARIIIGNNVPFVTGSYATSGGTSTVNPFTTVERKDVGLMLRIRPTINENGTVKLMVSQEASSIDRSTLNNVNGPSTSKRSIESTVLVDDGAIIMIGGLMQDSYSNSIDKIPLLGDMPVVGNLFKSENRTRGKSNLMVFLRPIILRDGKASQDLALDRYSQIRGLQQQTQPQPSSILGNVSQAPVAPELVRVDAAVQPLAAPVVQPMSSLTWDDVPMHSPQ